MNVMQQANLLERASVVAKRDGWIETKEYGDVVGLVRRDVNAAGKPIWRAQAGDIGRSTSPATAPSSGSSICTTCRRKPVCST